MTTTAAPLATATEARERPRTRAKRAGFFVRFRTMAVVGLRMMFFDKLKLFGTLMGVVFAVVLSNQQAGTFLGLLYKNLMFLKNTNADIWMAAPGTEALGPGKTISTAALMQAKVTPGAAWAEPLLYGSVGIKLPNGGTEQVTLIGTKYPRYAGGPWNVVVGDKSVLDRPDTMMFEDSERDTLGGLNVGSIREVNGRRMTVGGFTWGLVPFGAAFAFADYETARELMKAPNDQVNFILVGVEPGADPNEVKKELQRRVPEAVVLTKDELATSTVKYILFRTALGVTFGTSTLFGLIVGFVIVALSMFSAVVDNIREFGTLKAVGATNGDLAMLLFVQSVTYALLGSILGLGLVTRMAAGIRSAKLALNLPPVMTFGTMGIMILMCIFASSLALLRLRKVEPAMVFR